MKAMLWTEKLPQRTFRPTFREQAFTLTVYDNGDNAGDNAVWANPRLSLDGESAAHSTDYVTASLTDFEWKSAVSESKNPQINKPYQDGADYKINVGGIEYNYGISAHPYNETTPRP